MTYSFGNGVFWPTMVLIAVHCILIVVSRIVYQRIEFGNHFEMKHFFHCCFYGLANIYCPTWIPYKGASQENLKDVTSKSRTIHREIFMTFLFLFENIFILIIMIYSTLINSGSIIYNNMILLHITFGAIFSHVLGVFLRFSYLNQYHVWRDLIWADFWSKDTWPSLFRKDASIKTIENSEMIIEMKNSNEPENP